MAAVPISFLLKPIQVNVGSILPSRGAPTNLLTSRKYKQIRASIQQIDLIEPLSVSPVDKKTGQHVLLDGHIRWTVLKELGYTEAPCLIATDDESFTYNNRVNRLSSIQEHVMLRRAVDRGVSAERLANALAINLAQIETRLKLLDGICAEAAELLKDRTASVEVFNSLRKMKPTRQIECAELMISANNVSSVYARAMLSATPPDRLVNATKSHRAKAVSEEQMALMQREMTGLQDQYRMAEQTYGEDMLNLVLARGYIAKLIDNKRVRRYLEQHHTLLLEQFVSIVSVKDTFSGSDPEARATTEG